MILAGLLGAIISSIDSMMNSAATLVTMDVYKKYVNPEAAGQRLIRVGQLASVAIVGVSAFLALTTYDPQSRDNFFLKVSSQSSHFTPGLVAAFLLGMFDRRATARGAIAAILATPVLSFGSEALYTLLMTSDGAFASAFGPIFGAKLNFMHRVAFVFAMTILIHVLVSRATGPADESRAPYLWIYASGANPAVLQRTLLLFAAFLVFQAILAAFLQIDLIHKVAAAWLSSTFTLSLFILHIRHEAQQLYKDDRFYAGLVSAATMFIMFYFY